MKVLIFGNCITENCLAIRNNSGYLSVASRKKVIALSKNLAGLGYVVDICSVSYSKHINPMSKESISEEIRIIHSPTLGFRGRLSFFKRTVGTVFNIWWLLSHRKDYDAVIFWNYHIEFSLPALVGKWLFGIKAIMDFEDGLFLDKGYQGVFYSCWEKIVYRHSSGFILVNNGLNARLDQFITKERPIVIIHGFVDRDLLLEHKNVKKGPVRRIVFSGNFNSGFGFQELIAYVDYMDENIDFEITGKASSSEEMEIKKRISKRKNIKFHGFVNDEDFNGIVERADAFILLNDISSAHNQTNFPSKFFDYISRNKFVVTTRNPLIIPYLHLKNLILINNIQHDAARLHIISKHLETDYREIESLERDFRVSLENFLNELTLASHSAGKLGLS